MHAYNISIKKAARGDYTHCPAPQCSILLSLAEVPTEDIKLCPQAVWLQSVDQLTARRKKISNNSGTQQDQWFCVTQQLQLD